MVSVAYRTQPQSFCLGGCPQIYADDVACSHGSTSGAVDEDARFYLTSRGIPRRTAEELLVLAFLDEAIAEVEDAALADELRERLAAWLARRR